MSSEHAFLATIEAQPDDRAVRLVYADWLEERGDPRAELIRIEETMREIPVTSHHYWDLKPRRGALRERCDAAWLGRMGYGTDYEPVFRDVPADWRGRWRLLREFTERWHKVPLPDIGGQPDRVRHAEEAVGGDLPPSMREWVAFTGDLEDRAADELLRDVVEIRDLADPLHLDALSLLLQGEGDYYWAVEREHLDEDDPPVQGYNLVGGEFEDDGPVAPRVTDFVLRHMIAYAHGHGGGFAAHVRPNGELLRRLAESFPVHSHWGNLRVFEATNIIVTLESRRGEVGRSYLRAEVFKPLPPQQVPDVLWDSNRQGGVSHGMFSPWARR